MGIGMAIGYPSGVFLGLALAKRLFNYPGSLLLGLAGVLVGVLPLVVGEMWPLLLPSSAAAILLLLLCPLLGTLGYHLGKS